MSVFLSVLGGQTTYCEPIMRGAQPWRTNRARVLRSNAPSAEDVLWEELRGRRLAGCKFVRQCPMGPYFVDFACREMKLVIEIDGATHSTPSEIASDQLKERYLRQRGFRVLRTHNDEVYENLEGVLEYLYRALTEEA